MPERPPFPFVVGSGRSGTTLLRLMLEQHPDLAIPPESRFVHLIRDGRDVGLSIREMSWGPSKMPALAEFWAKRIRTGRSEGARLGGARYLELRYEDLVEGPVRELRRVCAFLDLDFR